MSSRLALIVLLLAAQMSQFAARAFARDCAAGDEQSGTMTLDAAHQAICGESCCCPPDDCPCMGSREGQREAPPAPLPPPVRIDASCIDLILPLSALRGFDFRALSADRIIARAQPHAINPERRIHAILGVWLT